MSSLPRATSGVWNEMFGMREVHLHHSPNCRDFCHTRSLRYCRNWIFFPVPRRKRNYVHSICGGFCFSVQEYVQVRITF